MTWQLLRRQHWLALAGAAALASIVAAGLELCWFGPNCSSTSAPVSAREDTTIGWIDTPAAEAVVADDLVVTGWALDRAGVREMQLKIDGHSLPIRYGLQRPDVSKLHPGYPQSAAPGWEFRGQLNQFPGLRKPIEVRVVRADGTTKVLGRRSVIPPDALTMWSSLQSTDASPSAAFHFVMATSGIARGGATGIDDTYRPYISSTQRIGVSIPILYLRTTHGRARDWTFDPDFDFNVKCADRPVADDALNATLRYAAEKALPVQLVLNGGIWADATCNTPDWDLTDYLEIDPRNCQWTQDDKVFPDDHLKNLAGSTASPELARSLTYNVYARTVRRYKKRNLQDAARRIVEFARSHPTLFIGINLDSDTLMNPFYEEREWFDYNPDTLRQFREWLRGSGPYAGREPPPVPDLRAYRRPKPLTLDEVNRLAQRNWKSWDEVDPPRRFPGSTHQPLKAGESSIWDEPWFAEWDTFRKHLIALHYTELAQWALEAGIPAEKIFTSQGFVAPEGHAKPFAVYITSHGQNYDSGGVSVEGAIPRNGHLGAVLYGPAAENRALMEHRFGLFATFARMDPSWAIVETNVADLKHPQTVPQYRQSYRAFRDMFNYGARQVSLMAWNGSNGIFVNQPGYVTYTSWRNTPAEEAMRDHMISHAGLALGARLWTFGTAQHADDDGWSAERGSLETGFGSITASSPDAQASFLSPADQVIRQANAGMIVIALAKPAQIEALEVWGQENPDAQWRSMGRATIADVERSPAGLKLRLGWPWATQTIIERIKVVLTKKDASERLTIHRIGMLPVESSMPLKTTSTRGMPQPKPER